MANDHFGGKTTGLDMAQKLWQKTLHMGLAHFERQPLVERIAKHEAVNESGIDPRHAHHAATTNRGNALSQRFAAAAFKLEGGQYRFSGAAFGLKPHRIDHTVNTAHAFGLANDGVGWIVVIIEVDGDHAIGFLREVQSVLMVINHENLVGTQHSGAGCAHQAHGACAINGHAGTLTNTGIGHGLISRGQNV